LLTVFVVVRVLSNLIVGPAIVSEVWDAGLIQFATFCRNIPMIPRDRPSVGTGSGATSKDIGSEFVSTAAIGASCPQRLDGLAKRHDGGAKIGNRRLIQIHRRYDEEVVRASGTCF